MSSTLSETELGQSSLTQRRILLFFIPLAVSWIFMSVEGPVTAGIITRRGGEQAGLAGLALLVSLAIFIESPVIDLLTTSTTLSRTHAAYLQIRRFTAMLMLWVASIQALVSLTPFYWVLIERVIGAEHDVAVVLRPAMIVMIPWAAMVGWRRFLHGVLIRFDNTKPVGIGTSVRVISIVGFCLGLYEWTSIPGLTVAAIAMVAGVSCETLFIHLVSRPTIRRCLDPMVGTDEDKGLPMNELWHFHYPLTLATMTMILSMPLISAALARSPDSVRMLAAWGLAQGTMFLFRSVTFALPETVVALYRDTETRARLSEFCTRVGIVCGIAVLLAYFSGAANWFFRVVLDGKPEIVVLSALALLVTVLVPVVNARGALFRGLLAAHRE
ncbi:MAG TPA: hypothetical protein VNI20_12460, partial [Fimbriimonadaceae bacterium]|nr:hypothetical protein [Fimbriimonadaceae bacterium]